MDRVIRPGQAGLTSGRLRVSGPCRAATAWSQTRWVDSIWLFLLILAALVVMILVAQRQRKQRRHAVARFAAKSGMQYSQEDPFDLLSYGFPLLSSGDGQGCENVMSGQWQGLPVKEADFWYYTIVHDDQGSHRQYSYYSIVIADLNASVPYVSIQKESLFTRLADHLGFHDIDFESEEFNQKFRVKAPDREFAFKLIDARMMQWLLASGTEFAFDVQDSYLMVSCHRLPVASLAGLLGAAKGFTDNIPHLVWTDFRADGTGERISS